MIISKTYVMKLSEKARTLSQLFMVYKSPFDTLIRLVNPIDTIIVYYIYNVRTQSPAPIPSPPLKVNQQAAVVK